MSTRLTPRDEEVLLTLTTKLRVMTIHQVATLWFGGSVESAVRRVGQLDELLESVPALVEEPQNLSIPCLTWSPADPEPDFPPIAAHIKARFSEPLRSVRIVYATEKAGRLTGGVGGEVHGGTIPHDVCLSEVFLTLDAKDQRAWKGEAVLERSSSEARPDAVIVRRSGKTAVDFLGKSYTAERVRELWEWARDQGMDVKFY